MTTEIYLDNAAATPVDPRVVRAVAAASREQGNPSAVHGTGQRAAAVLARARKDIAGFLNAHPSEVVFCASGSEANTLAILGVAEYAPKRMRQIAVTPIEHPSVLEPVKKMSKQGRATIVIPVGLDGSVTAEAVATILTPQTLLVSVAYANSEIGTVQPIKAIAKAIRQWRRAHNSPYPYLHVDACQATAWLPMDVQALGVDLLTLNGAKAYGPRGTGVLYVRRGVALSPQVLGGDQEEGRRAGTENAAGAAGLAVALAGIKTKDIGHTIALRDRLFVGITDGIPDARVNGPVGHTRLPSNVNVSIPGVASEVLLLELDAYGIRASAGSACHARRTEPSHVLRAIGTPRQHLSGAVRFSLSRYTTRTEIDRVLKVLPVAVARVRARNLK